MGVFGRGRGAGYLHKQEVLTVLGPYAYTRNPLYLGSAILTLGVAVVARSWIAAAILCGYFALVYGVVMRREEQELWQLYGAAFDEYARRVPLFLPRPHAPKVSSARTCAVLFPPYKKELEDRAAIGLFFC